MEEEWIKVKELQRVSNLIKERRIIDYMQEEWKELLEQYKIKYKFDIVQNTEYVCGGMRSAVNMQKVYILNLYTTKEYLQQIKSIIDEYENATLEIPEELKKVEEEKIEEEYEDSKPMKVSKYFFTTSMILLILLEIGLILISEKSSDNRVGYILIAILIIVELYSIVGLNKRRGNNRNE